MPASRWLLAGAALAVLAGCGGRSPGEEVRATLAGFAHATAKRDYQALCDRYFAARLVAQVEKRRAALRGRDPPGDQLDAEPVADHPGRARDG